MTTKRWVELFLVFCIATLAVFAGMMVATDPLIQYGKEKKLFTYYEYAEMYSNPGIAKNYSYDTVLVGTSMIQNTDVQECNELLECDMVRLPYSGGTCHNMKTILDVCFDSDNKIKTVYWELDEFQLFSKHDETRFPLPSYLYRGDHRGDLSYLLNLDIFYHYTLNNVLGTLRGEQQLVAREGETFSGDFSKRAVLASYSRPQECLQEQEETIYLDKVLHNLEYNMIPLIVENPETEFVFFMPPFSMLYWDAQVRNGTFNASMYGVEYAIGRLLEYENVRVFFYHDQWEISTNLDNYKDFTHYGKWINSWITQALASGEGELTPKNYEAVLAAMREYVSIFDFDVYHEQ